MLGLQCAIDASASLTRLIPGCTAASKEYASHEKCIYSSNNKNFERIIEIMELLNNPRAVKEERKKLGHEWDLMSYYNEEKLNEASNLANSGQTVGDNLDYFRKVEVRNYDVRKNLKNINTPVYIFAGRHDIQCPVEFGIEIHEYIPHSELTIFEKSNHNPFIEEEEKFKKFVKLTV